MKQKFYGTGVAMVTPFTSQGEVDYISLVKLIKHVTDNGADYLVYLGTTGESSTLTGAEKNEIISFVKKNNPGKLPIMLGLGGNDTRELISKLNEIDFKGIDAVLSVCPYYNKPSQEGIFKHYTAFADHCPVPVMIYNIPGRTGVNITAETTLRLAKHKNIFGSKEAAGDLIQVIEISKNKPKDFLIVSGDDLMTLPMMSVGGVGTISAVSNALTKPFSAMVNKGLEGDFTAAQQEMFKFCEINTLLFAEGNPVGIKAILAQMGICDATVRMPLSEASEELTQKINQKLKSLGFIQ